MLAAGVNTHFVLLAGRPFGQSLAHPPLLLKSILTVIITCFHYSRIIIQVRYLSISFPQNFSQGPSLLV